LLFVLLGLSVKLIIGFVIGLDLLLLLLLLFIIWLRFGGDNNNNNNHDEIEYVEELVEDNINGQENNDGIEAGTSEEKKRKSRSYW